MGKSNCCERVGLNRGPWKPEEDKKLLAYIQEYGHGNWRALPEKAGLERCGKSCRLRWTNYLRPDIKRGKFSLQEEQAIIQLHALLGNRWSAIAAQFPGRTDNEIKNHWNTHIKKRLNKMGIDPVTHKPKTHAFGSTKDAANLSHMAQWETARLEAEARLVRETNLLRNKVTGLAMPQLSGNIPCPPAAPLYYLDAKSITRPSINETAYSTSLLNATAFASVALESPASILNFPASTIGTANHVSTYQENGGKYLSSSKNQSQILEPEQKHDFPNNDCTWSNNIMQGYSDLCTNNDFIGHGFTSLAPVENFDIMARGNSESNFDQEMRSYYCSMLTGCVSV